MGSTKEIHCGTNMWKQRLYNKDVEQEFIRLGKNKFLSRLLAQRNIQPLLINKFIEPTYDNLSRPYALNGVKEASELFCKIALKKGNIGVSSDYDADGIFSAVMIKELCNVFHLNCKVFLPSRSDHGYGLSKKSIESMKVLFKRKLDLLIVADCGSCNEEEIKEIKNNIAKHVIILDHHPIDNVDKLSKSADILINWHLQDNFEETCACGEVFHFIRGIRWLTKKINPIEFISYAAIGILADVSPVVGNNRIIVKNGLSEYALKHVVASGLNALLRKSNIYTQDVSQGDILFKIAPKINSAGRLKKPDIAFRLLVEHDPSTAELMAINLNEYNDERKEIQRDIEIEAIKIVNENKDQYKNGILLFNPSWTIGVVGIVASKLAETFCKPSIVVGQSGDIIRGSGRSIGNINLKEILDDCKEMFVTYGGHPSAAGVVLKKEYIDKANTMFNEACSKYYNSYGFPSEIRYYDLDIKPELINMRTAKMLLNNLYPYCNQNNPEPIFLISNATIINANLIEKDNWKMLVFEVSKDGKKSSMKMRMFTDLFGGEINQSTADIYFSLPQTVTKDRFGDPPINVVDFVLKK